MPAMSSGAESPSLFLATVCGPSPDLLTAWVRWTLD